MHLRHAPRDATAVLAALALGLAIESSTASARADDASASSIEALAAQAYELHAAGRFAEAIGTYLRVYDACGAGVALLNVATIYDRKLHERGLAAGYYRRYLVAPDAEPALIAKATERLALFKQDDDAEKVRVAAEPSVPASPSAAPTTTATHPIPVATAQATPTAPTTPTPLPEEAHAADLAVAIVPSGDGSRSDGSRSGAAWRTVGIVVGAVGVAAVGPSLVLGAVAMAKNDAANAMCAGASCSSVEGVDLARDAGRFATASTAVFFSGLAVAAGGLTIVLAAPRARGSARTPALAFSPQLGAGGTGLHVAGDF